LLQDLSCTDQILEQVTFSIIPTDTGGVIVFSWIGNNTAGKRFLKSLDAHSDAELPNVIARIAFEYLENTFSSPTWWDSLDETDKKVLCQRQISGTTLKRRTAQSLRDDGLDIVSWPITSRDTNIDLSIES